MRTQNKRKWLAVWIIVFTAGYASLTAAQTVRLTVKGDGKKDSESDHSKNTRKKTETEIYGLNITLANPLPQSATYTLEWYFFNRKVTAKSKSDPTVYDRGSKNFTVPGQRKVSHTVASQPVVKVETTVSSNRGGGRGRGGGNSKKTISGSEYCAYVVLVRCNGKIIAKQSNSKTLLKPETLDTLRPSMSVNNFSSDGKSAKGKKKKKKKKK